MLRWCTVHIGGSAAVAWSAQRTTSDVSKQQQLTDDTVHDLRLLVQRWTKCLCHSAGMPPSCIAENYYYYYYYYYY